MGRQRSGDVITSIILKSQQKYRHRRRGLYILLYSDRNTRSPCDTRVNVNTVYGGCL